MSRAAERAALAQVIADSFYAMQAGELPDAANRTLPSAGDMQLASDIQEAGYVLVDQGPASPSLEELPSEDLPGMWDHSDFMGGRDEAEHYSRQINDVARAIAGLSEKLWDQALEDALHDPQTLALVRYYRHRAVDVLKVAKA